MKKESVHHSVRVICTGYSAVGQDKQTATIRGANDEHKEEREMDRERSRSFFESSRDAENGTGEAISIPSNF